MDPSSSTRAHGRGKRPGHRAAPPCRRSASAAATFRWWLRVARDDAALARRIGDIDAHLEAEPALAAADLARTLDEGRRAFAHRAAFVVAGDRAEKLGTPIAAGRAPDGPASVVFLFPGQGSQRYGAGRGLYATEPVFREAIDACAARLEGTLALDLRDLLGYGEKAAPSAEAASQLRRTAHAQPALFAVGYATARLLMRTASHWYGPARWMVPRESTTGESVQ